MARQVIFQKRFLNKLEKLLIYLEKEWGIKVSNEFLDKLHVKIEALKLHPNTGQVTSLKNIRNISITKHNRIYYKIKENKIAVINMIDTLRNPKKNPFNKPK